MILSNARISDPEMERRMQRSVILPAGDFKVGFFGMLSPWLFSVARRADELIVKRLSADDSVVVPCESRSLPNTYSKPLIVVGGFYFVSLTGLANRTFLPLIAVVGRNGVIL